VSRLENTMTTTATRRIPFGRIVGWVILGFFLLVTLFPFYWMLRTSFSTNGALASHSESLLPADTTVDAYRRVLGLSSVSEALEKGGSTASVNFWLYLRNSFVVAISTTVVQTIFSALAAYAFARMRWPGRNVVFTIFLFALMVPPIFTTLPNFILIRDLGLLNTFLGIVLPNLLMSPFAVFFLRQFFLNISNEVEEAARLDGAGHLRIFFRIIVPMSAAPITTLAILTYVASWNDYFWPLLVGQDENVRVLTVALGIFKAQTPNGGPDWAGLMAATVIAALPVIVLFTLLGKRVINSIQFSGVK
jgi:multiple sugar transport system permease protein